ncbi:desulfoferrodoxin [candidate division LCP-89 bacterium B3_LCP]|uniref:Desulfoferrodoxin n=1 Tax=candidate division LCP-89 bacterium B3_LCP TaxID=2012998 RepID=A0A532V4M5_UNCL8|nr:MAG: desulfoferrodoxin [candidate division LCP-89 bacterium B3_LCP]
MADRFQIYKCEKCGNIVSVMHGAGGTLECCHETMKLLEENTTDAALEKHVPVLEKTGSAWKVSVGSVAHPMGDDHYIEWIELLYGDKSCAVFLKPGDTPEALFQVQADNVTARAYCNLHGLWKS